MSRREVRELQVPRRAGAKGLGPEVRMYKDGDSEEPSTHCNLESGPPFYRIERIVTELSEGGSVVPRAESEPILSRNEANGVTEGLMIGVSPPG